MQWLRPLIDKPMNHLSRNFPRIINRLSVKQRGLLVNMVPTDGKSVSETYLFANGKSCRMLWEDNTLYESVVDQNGYLLRSNYFGNVTYGNHENMFTYNSRVYTNLTYSAMAVYDKHLWCATEYTMNDTVVTRVDAFDLFVKLNDTDYISSVPDMTFLIENKGCVGPHLLSVSIDRENIYIIIGYMMGGVNVAQAVYPVEKKPTRMMCSNLPNEHIVRSISWDKPFLFFLDEHGISSYKIFPRADIHQYMGKYDLRKKYFSETTQIASIKKQVFWNGENILYSVEIVE
jgi:hypothetical protein